MVPTSPAGRRFAGQLNSFTTAAFGAAARSAKAQATMNTLERAETPSPISPADFCSEDTCNCNRKLIRSTALSFVRFTL